MRILVVRSQRVDMVYSSNIFLLFWFCFSSRPEDQDIDLFGLHVDGFTIEGVSQTKIARIAKWLYHEVIHLWAEIWSEILIYNGICTTIAFLTFIIPIIYKSFKFSENFSFLVFCCYGYFTVFSMSLREKCPNTELFLVRIFMYSVRIQENTDQK